MKHGKVLTRAQKELLEEHGFDWRNYLRVKDLPRLLQVVHKQTGNIVTIMKKV